MTFNELNLSSRLWVFTSNRILNETESDYIRRELSLFLSDWNTHGKAMHAACDIYHHQLVLVAADEQLMAASGCSLDKLTHEIQRVAQHVGVNLMDRLTVFYEEEKEIKSTSLSTFWALRKANRITDDTLVLDTTVKNLAEWKETAWKKFGNSWHKEMYGR